MTARVAFGSTVPRALAASLEGTEHIGRDAHDKDRLPHRRERHTAMRAAAAPHIVRVERVRQGHVAVRVEPGG